MKVPTGEASEGSKIIIKETERSKFMDKYAQLKRFHNDLQLQVYMYAFMYADPGKFSVEDHFPDTKHFALNYNNNSIPGTVPKYWLGFSYIRSEYYEFYQNFYDRDFKKIRPNIQQ